MRRFLQFVFWLAIGAIGSGAGSALYLISAVRRIELFPALAGAVVVSGLLLAILVRGIAWAQAHKPRREAVETFFIAKQTR
jgi:hypothetical protein